MAKSLVIVICKDVDPYWLYADPDHGWIQDNKIKKNNIFQFLKVKNTFNFHVWN